MDLVTVREIRTPACREELRLGPGDRPLGGGTWLFSEEQPGCTGLVDLTSLGWEALTRTDTHLTIAATCTIATLTRMTGDRDWRAQPLIGQCANALLASNKIWNVATVGGNVALAIPAGAMTSLLATLDATAVIWTPDGGERRIPVAAFVTGVRTTALLAGEVLRAIEVPIGALRSWTGFRRIALSPYGRSGALVTGRLDDAGGFVLVVTAATTRPVQLRFATVPDAVAVTEAVAAIDCWYDDPHGAPDWRRAMSARFALEIRDDASAASAAAVEGGC